MVNLTEVMSAGGTIDAVVYIYSDGVCEFEINSYDSTDIKVEDQSDDKYGLMIDNYVDAIRRFGEMKDGAIDIEFDHNMIHLPSVQNGGVEGSDVPLAGEQQQGQEAISKSDGAEAVSVTEDNGGEAGVGANSPQTPPPTIYPQNKISYGKVKTYLETRPNTYIMYDLLTCKWISIINNELSTLDATRTNLDENIIYNPVLNAFYKVADNVKNKEILNHNLVKKYETQDNTRFSHYEEFWEYNNTSKKWIYGRWINGTEYKFKYDNGWLIT
jgi:hypothetical protein